MAFASGGAWAAPAASCSGPARRCTLLPKAAGSAAAEATTTERTYERHWTPVHLDFVVSDVEQARARALAAGATTEGAISDHVWGRTARLADPFGHGVCLIAFRGRGHDALAEG